MALLTFPLTACNGQNRVDKKDNKTDTIKPKVDIKVHKEYDEQGNLISVDSTYSYLYSNIKNDSLLEKEIFDRFKYNMDAEFKPFDSIFMEDFFKTTPFTLKDFYTDEFFLNNFRMHHKRIEDIFKQMDSLKNKYYLEQKELMKMK